MQDSTVRAAFSYCICCCIVFLDVIVLKDNLYAVSIGGKNEGTNVAYLTASVDPEVTKPSNYKVPWESKFNLPPQDAEGWSILTPSPDSTLIYISEDGDDIDGQVYSISDPEIGPDVQNPIGPVNAYKTFSHVIKVVARDKKPDWILFKRGDTFDSEAVIVKSGRSLSERAVITYYGTHPDRPLIKTGTSGAIQIRNNNQFVAIVGLDFYADKRDPNSDNFAGFLKGSVVGFQSWSGNPDEPIKSILIEDSVFRFYSGNSIQSVPLTEDFIVRRSQIYNSYSAYSHSQGIFALNSSVLLEENLFDHNGWLKQQIESGKNQQDEGQATIFSHNTYFSDVRDIIFRKNIFARASSMGNKFTANARDTGGMDVIKTQDVLLDNNLYVEGEIGISAGGNIDNGNGHRWQNINIVNNILLDIGRTRPTNRDLAWGLDARDWNGGLISGNFLLNFGDLENVKNVWTIKLGGHDKDVEVSSNVIYNLNGKNNNMFGLGINPDPKSYITIFNNEIQLLGNKNLALVIDNDNPAATSFSNNVYYSENNSTGWMEIDGNPLDFDSWVSESGDIGSRVEKLTYLDPKRTIETYSASLGHEATLDAFIEEAKKQSKFNWRPEYTAEAVNAYIREGFIPTSSNNTDAQNETN